MLHPSEFRFERAACAEADVRNRATEDPIKHHCRKARIDLACSRRCNALAAGGGAPHRESDASQFRTEATASLRGERGAERLTRQVPGERGRLNGALAPAAFEQDLLLIPAESIVKFDSLLQRVG